MRKQSMHVGGEPVRLAGIVSGRAGLTSVARQVATAIGLGRSIGPRRLDVLQRLRVLLRYGEQRTRSVGDQIGRIETVKLLGAVPFLDLKLKRIRVERAPCDRA